MLKAMLWKNRIIQASVPIGKEGFTKSPEYKTKVHVQERLVKKSQYQSLIAVKPSLQPGLFVLSGDKTEQHFDKMVKCGIDIKKN